MRQLQISLACLLLISCSSGVPASSPSSASDRGVDARIIQREIANDGGPRTVQQSLDFARFHFPLTHFPIIIGNYQTLRDGTRAYSGTVKFVQNGIVENGVVRGFYVSRDGYIQIYSGARDPYHLKATSVKGDAVSTVTVVPEQ